MEGTTTLLKIESGRVSVIRTGSIEAKQVFAAGEKIHFSLYHRLRHLWEWLLTPGWWKLVCREEKGG